MDFNEKEKAILYVFGNMHKFFEGLEEPGEKAGFLHAKKSLLFSVRKLDDALKNRYNKTNIRKKDKGEKRYGQQTDAVHPAGRHLSL